MPIKEKTIEVCRSFSQKVNLGNYETCDFFCSAKAEVAEKDFETTSAELFERCYNEVMGSILEFKAKQDTKDTKQWEDKQQEINKNQ